MAAPDIPQPAKAPHRPQNSAESHNDCCDVSADGRGAVSAVLTADSLAVSVASLATVFAGLSTALSANLRDIKFLEAFGTREYRRLRESETASLVARRMIGRLNDAMVHVDVIS